MEKHCDASKDLHMVTIDFEKAFDRLPRDLIWAALRNRDVPEIYVKMIQDMYECTKTKMRCSAGITD